MKYRFVFFILLSVGLVLSCKTDLQRKVEVETEMLAGQRLHDGALELQTIGDIKSVPALLVVLKENPPLKSGAVVCTTAHALQALRDITKENPGIRYEDWLAWWDDYGKQNPSVE